MISNRLVFDFFTELEYPRKLEVAEIVPDIPKLPNFGFQPINEMRLLIEEELTFEAVKKSGDLFWWDNHLSNKLGKLRLSYIVAMTNYKRCIFQDPDNFSSTIELNRILFEYYCEGFYYHYFSARETILQITNLYFDLPLNEHQVRMSSVLAKIGNIEVTNALKKFEEDAKLTSDIRNAFTHRFPMTKKDHRSKIVGEGSERVFHGGGGNSMPPAEAVDNMRQSLDILQALLTSVASELVIEGN